MYIYICASVRYHSCTFYGKLGRLYYDYAIARLFDEYSLIDYYVSNSILISALVLLTEILGYSLTMAGSLSGIPYFVMALLLPLAGFMGDYGVIKGYITKTQVTV